MPFPFIDPVLLDLPGPLAVRWYAVGYLLGAACAYAVLIHLTRTGFLKLETEKVFDLLGWVLIGMIVGGRVGYLVFYAPDRLMADPLKIIRIWEGGLSFHGGLIGLAAAGALYARSEGIPVLRLFEAFIPAGPFGIFFVRVANFINGELYGRVAGPDVPWAVRFPTDPVALRAMGIEGTNRRVREEAILQAQETGAWQAVQDQVPLRHPSQLYEAIGEGLVLAAVAWAILLFARRRGRRPPTGLLTGAFLAGYGVIRSIIELYRQPDEQFRTAENPLGTVLGPLTMGQVLSLIMVVVGVALIVHAVRRRASDSTG